jgi:hypothetical protein
MSAWWALPMLLAGGLFAGGVLSIAWERIPAWRAADLPDFRIAFEHTLLLVGATRRIGRRAWVSSSTRRNRDDKRAGSY